MEPQTSILRVEDEEISLLDLFTIAWKRRRLIFWITLLGFVCSFGYVLGSTLLPPEKSYLPTLYRPQSTMLIGGSNSSGLSSILSSSGLGDIAGLTGLGGGGNSNGELAVALAKSNTTLDELSDRFRLSERYRVKRNVKALTRSSILKYLSTKFDTKSNLFTVSFEDYDPDLARDVVNSLVAILEKRFATLGGSKANTQKDLLEVKLNDVKASIAALEEDTKLFQAKYGVVSVEALATEQMTILARLRSELIIKDLEISNYQKISMVDDPIRRRFEDEKASLLAKIRELESGKGQAIGERVMPNQRELPTIAFEYAKLQRDLLVQAEVYKILTQQYEIAKLNAAGQEPIFQILELAEAPDLKSGPSRSMICILTTMISFFGSILLVFALDTVDKVRRRPIESTGLVNAMDKDR